MKLMLILVLNETTDQLAMGNSVRWHGGAIWREDGHVLRRAQDCEIEGQRKNWRSKRAWEEQVEDKGMEIRFSREDEHCSLTRIVGSNQIAPYIEVKLATITNWRY